MSNESRVSRRGWLRLSWLIVGLGCSPKQVSSIGGTSGSIHVGSKYFLPEVQVNVHLLDGGWARCIGMGVSGLDGKFNLFTADGKEPLWLSPGQYAVTLESIGPNMLVWKEPVRNPTETPLRKTWKNSDTTLDLDVPEPRVRAH